VEASSLSRRQNATVTLRATTWPQRLIAAGFIAIGIGHFVNTSSFTGIVPDYLPAHLALVLLSGLAEIAGGVGILMPRHRRRAGQGLILLLIAVFPANIDMLVHADEQSLPEALLWARLPLQPLLAWAVYRATLREPTRGAVPPLPARA
jgi:uncharacterized membrane protein